VIALQVLWWWCITTHYSGHQLPWLSKGALDSFGSNRFFF
jgi:hypothetical protein